MKWLILLLLIFSSCTTLEKDRNPASLTNNSLLESFWRYSSSYLLDHRPKNWPSQNEILRNKKELYSYLGKVDKGDIRGIPSRVIRKTRGLRYVLNLKGAKQITYKRWQHILPTVLDTYASGEHVFLYEGEFYTLWGVKLSKANIDENIIKKMKDNFPGKSINDFLLSFFNHHKVVKVSEDSFYTIPELKRVSDFTKNRLMNDFSSQLESHHTIDLNNILNYDVKRTNYKLDEYQNFFADKFKLSLKNELPKDHRKACKLKLYLKGLSVKLIPREFINTLIKEKENLMEELNLTNNEYNELFIIAIGVLAVESKMGYSPKYKMKEGFIINGFNIGQLSISLLKKLRGRTDNNSRGLTQIKNLGPLLKNTTYKYLEYSDLNNPSHAAIATMFVLREKFGYLMHFKDRHNHINSYNWSDYVYYFYQGSSGQVLKGTATPKHNLRIQKILNLRNNMILFQNCD
jgi:hypothetical protein